MDRIPSGWYLGPSPRRATRKVTQTRSIVNRCPVPIGGETPWSTLGSLARPRVRVEGHRPIGPLDRCPPPPARVARRQRLGADLIDVVVAGSASPDGSLD